MSESKIIAAAKPEKAKPERRRNLQTFRIPDSRKAQLEQVADQNQRSISEEVEYRLQRYDDFARIFDGFFNDKPSREFFNILSSVVAGLRRRAKERGMSEVDTRAALTTAVNHITEIFFWQGGEVSSAPEGYHREGALQNNPTPEIIGYSAASDHMMFESIYDRCELMDNFCDSQIKNYWSGDGTEAIDAEPGIEEKEPSRPLSEIMPRDQGAPISPLFEKKARKPKKKGDDDA